MGMGHLFRMRTLYREIHRAGQEALFVLLGQHLPSEAFLTDEQVPYLTVTDTSLGWEAQILRRFPVRLWINDRLDTDIEHIRYLQAHGIKSVTFDDNGSGAALSDLHVAALAPMRGDQPQGALVLTGTDYLILPDSIARYRRLRSNCHSLVVSLGATDTHGVTIKLLPWLRRQSISATIILGPGFEHHAELADAGGCQITIKSAVPSLVAEFANYDLAITGGGLTAFEAAAAGLPTLTVANEPHEIGHCQYLQIIGCSHYSGFRDTADFSILNMMLDIPKMSQAAIANFSLEGTGRVYQALHTLIQ